MSDKKNKDNDIGYGKPPKAKRFKKGESGNPKGRPKGAKNFSTVLDDELKSRILITEDGKKKMISKREAIAKQLVNKAASGDHRTIPIVLNEMRHHEGIENTPSLRTGEFQEDQLVMTSLLKRIRATKAPTS